MSDMAACAAFIRARLDMDQAVAEDALNDVIPYHTAIQRLYQGGWHSERSAHHLDRFDPARVLAQVAAMRAIVDFHEQWPVLVETPPELTTSTDAAGSMSMRMSQRMAWVTTQEYRKRFGEEPPAAPMLRHLAAIWSEHADYDPAWAPDA